MKPSEIDDLLGIDSGDETPEETAARNAREEKLEEQRRKLLAAVSAGSPETIEQRVAWILNSEPKARDSDISLMLAYWEAFESEYSGGSVSREQLYKFTRLTTLTRARARIQNQFHLFEASASI